MTRSGIEYNLKISPYKYTLNYENEILTFFFSSNSYLEKFKNEISNNFNRNKLFLSLKNRYGIDIFIDVIADLCTYKNIEKRGFYIYSESERREITCLEEIYMEGTKIIYKKQKE